VFSVGITLSLLYKTVGRFNHRVDGLSGVADGGFTTSATLFYILLFSNRMCQNRCFDETIL